MTDHQRANDLEIGKLIQAVDTLTQEVTTLRGQMEDMSKKVNTGRGLFYGALFAAGSAGAGLSQLLDRITP